MLLSLSHDSSYKFGVKHHLHFSLISFDHIQCKIHFRQYSLLFKPLIYISLNWRAVSFSNKTPKCIIIIKCCKNSQLSYWCLPARLIAHNTLTDCLHLCHHHQHLLPLQRRHRLETQTKIRKHFQQKEWCNLQVSESSSDTHSNLRVTFSPDADETRVRVHAGVRVRGGQLHRDLNPGPGSLLPPLPLQQRRGEADQDQTRLPPQCQWGGQTESQSLWGEALEMFNPTVKWW